MATIFFVINEGFSCAYLLQSEIFKALADKDNRIVVLSAAGEDENFKDTFNHKNVRHVAYRGYEASVLSKKVGGVFRQVRLLSFPKTNNYTRHWRSVFFRKKLKQGIFGWLTALPNFLLIVLVSGLHLGPRLLEFLEKLIVPNTMAWLFLDERPDWVVVTSLGWFGDDNYIMQDARRFGAKICCLPLSWDNTTTKGVAAVKPDAVVAWSEIMKSELMEFHQIAENAIFVGGVQKFDLHVRSRQAGADHPSFRRNLGISETKKVISLFLESPTAFQNNIELIRILGRQLERLLGDNYLLVIRPHPITFRRHGSDFVYEDEISDLERQRNDHPNILIDPPSLRDSMLSHWASDKDELRLSALLQHSDVVVAFYSSIFLEASIFQKPIINIGLFSKNEIPNKVLQAHRHNSRVFTSGVVYNAQSEAQLSDCLESALEIPDRFAVNQKLLIEREAGENCGNAGAIIAKHLANLLVKDRA